MIIRSTDPAEFTREQWRYGFPWCDVCEEPALVTEPFGWRHASAEYPAGIPAHIDQSDHAISALAWLEAPFARRDAEESAE